MQRLPVAAALDGLHQQVLRGDKGQILPHGARDDLLVDAQPVRDVLGQTQNRVGAEKPLRHGDTAVGAVVQRPLQPLHAGRHRRVRGVRHQVTRQRADALAAHGVALIGHRGGADLAVLEGLLELTVVLQQADVVCHAVQALGDGGQGVQDAAVHLAGVGLAADVIAAVEAEGGGEAAVHLVDLRAVAVEEVEEAGLRARRAAAAEEFDVLQREVQLAQVGEEVLHPERRALADGDELGGLIVGIAQRRRRLVAVRELREVRQHPQQLAAQVFQPVAVEDQVGVVGHIAACRAEVDDACGARRGLAVGVDVRHHVMPHFLFALPHAVIVNVGDVALQLGHLRRGDGQAKLHLGPRQRGPELPPGLTARVRGEEPQHEI